VLYLGTPGVGLRGIYGLIARELGATPRFHRSALIPQAQELLAAESSERGKQVVLIIDEAHLLDAESLEGVRCLSNMGMDRTAPFCLLLLGQPTLRRRLRQGTFTALDQRIAVRYAIAGLSAKETESYVCHHLALAGRSDTLFSDDALALIHEVSRGLPRQVNNLALASLIAAFTEKKAMVDQSSARAAVAEISAE
jgi:type II secretory pathway predicted ATPase ExeA